MTIARIYRPTRGATQSGHARTKAWLLEYERMEPVEIEPMMGWTGSSETEMQVKVTFDTREEADRLRGEARHRLRGRGSLPSSRSAAASPTRTISNRRASVSGPTDAGPHETTASSSGGARLRSSARIEQPPSKRQVEGSSPSGVAKDHRRRGRPVVVHPDEAADVRLPTGPPHASKRRDRDDGLRRREARASRRPSRHWTSVAPISGAGAGAATGSAPATGAFDATIASIKL